MGLSNACVTAMIAGRYLLAAGPKLLRLWWRSTKLSEKPTLGMIQDYSDSELMVILTYMEKMSGMAELLLTDVIAARSEG